MTKQTFQIEVTDTFGGEANYSWVRRHVVKAKSMRGAATMLGRIEGSGWRLDYSCGDFRRYVVPGMGVCAFITHHEEA